MMEDDVIVIDNRKTRAGTVIEKIEGRIIAYDISANPERLWLTLDTGFTVSISLKGKFAEVISKIVSEDNRKARERLRKASSKS